MSATLNNHNGSYQINNDRHTAFAATAFLDGVFLSFTIRHADTTTGMATCISGKRG